MHNGYEVNKGNRLKSFKSVLQGMDVPEIYFGNIAKSSQLGILDFRAFLNLAMLMVESERARLLRQAILDIVMMSYESDRPIKMVWQLWHPMPVEMFEDNRRGG